MRLEIKGLVAALLAAVVVLGGVFGLSAIITHGSVAPGNQSVTAAQVPGTMKNMVKVMDKATQADIEHGRLLFTSNCSACHGNAGQGAFGPDLRSTDRSAAQIATTIMNGAKGMPPFKSKLTQKNITDITEFTRTLKK